MASESGARVQHLQSSDWQKTRSFSPAIITEDGRIVWLAGQTTLVDLDGKDIAGKFEEQARTIFALIDRTLQRAGGTLANFARPGCVIEIQGVAVV